MNNKPLIATIVFNSELITKECFLPSLVKSINVSKFDLLIVNTDNNIFKLDRQFNCLQLTKRNYMQTFGISSHALAIQKILDDNASKYNDIIICENDVIVKKDFLEIIDKNYQFVGQLSGPTNRSWYTAFFDKFRLQCNRWFPQLMYFNMQAFKDRKVKYYNSNIMATIKIPSLNLEQTIKNHAFGDPGWYFLLWTIQNNIKCKNINIDEYISHFWYGSENRNKSINEYTKRLEEFKQANIQYL